MLFSIYSASLIALSSGIALEKRAELPAGKTDCKLYVTVDAIGVGWVKEGEGNTLTTTGAGSKKFEDGSLFEFGVGQQNGSFNTLQTTDKTGAVKEIALNKAKKSLSLRDRDTPDYTGAAWVAPKPNFRERPTELIIESEQKELPVQYCASKDGKKPAILSVAGEDGYECKEAIIFVRFIYTSVETFPQKAKIAVYKKEKLDHLGWLYLSPDNIHPKYDINPVQNYETANEFSLQTAAGGMKIYWGEKSIRKPADPTGDLTYDKGDSQIFQWADGNPQQIVPSRATTLYCCAPKDKTNTQSPTFHAEKPTDAGLECFEVLWILSVIG